MDIRGLELRRMALNLFSLKDGLGKTTEKMGDNDEIQKKLKVVETQLMSIITSSGINPLYELTRYTPGTPGSSPLF